MLFRYWDILDPYPRQTKLLSKLRPMPFSVLLQDSLLGVGSVCGLGPDLVGIHSISLAARYRTAACSNTLNQGLEKIQAVRAFDFGPILALCPNGEKEFLAPSMARSTAEAFNTIPTETNLNDFGGFLELISRFEFDFRRRGNYF